MKPSAGVRGLPAGGGCLVSPEGSRAAAWVSSQAFLTTMCSGQKGFGSSLSLLAMDKTVWK